MLLIREVAGWNFSPKTDSFCCIPEPLPTNAGAVQVQFSCEYPVLAVMEKLTSIWHMVSASQDQEKWPRQLKTWWAKCISSTWSFSLPLIRTKQKASWRQQHNGSCVRSDEMHSSGSVQPTQNVIAIVSSQRSAIPTLPASVLFFGSLNVAP
jgi:hypothetical protein